MKNIMFKVAVHYFGDKIILFFRHTNLPRILGNNRLYDFINNVFVKRYCGSQLVDAGANHGDVAFSLSKIFNPSKIVMIEPQTHLADKLRKRFPNHEVIEGVLGSDSKEARLYFSDLEDPLVSQSANLYQATSVLNSSILVRGFSLAELPIDWDLGGILKIDIEGAELNVMREFLNINPKKSWLILVEDHSILFSGLDKRNYRDKLRSLINRCEQLDHNIIKWI